MTVFRAGVPACLALALLACAAGCAPREGLIRTDGGPVAIDGVTVLVVATRGEKLDPAWDEMGVGFGAAEALAEELARRGSPKFLIADPSLRNKVREIQAQYWKLGAGAEPPADAARGVAELKPDVIAEARVLSLEEVSGKAYAGPFQVARRTGYATVEVVLQVRGAGGPQAAAVARASSTKGAKIVGGRMDTRKMTFDEYMIGDAVRKALATAADALVAR